ncbi:MAG: hypothetical protein U0871_22010 [Gemmataceae bacterium]
MPRRRFAIPPLPEQVVDRPDQLAELVCHLQTAPVIGLDTEFVGEDSYRPELCLVQVSTPDRLAIIDPFACGPLDDFWEVLLDSRRTTVVHAGREECRMCHFAVGRPPATAFDTQIAAGLVGFTFPIGYAGLVQEVLGARARKGETLTDWRRRPLTHAQIRYAFDDVRFLLPLHHWLTTRMKRLDRLGWAEEEFAGYVREWVSDEAAAEKWRRLKGLGGLDRRELAVARGVRLAGGVRRPGEPAAGTVLRDDLIAEIARRPPTRADDLATLRGLPRGEAGAILTAVRAAAAVPDADLPVPAERENDPPHVAALAGLLGVVLADVTARLRIASNLVATAQDLKGLVRARQPGGELPADSPLACGWRAAAIRPHLDAVLDGRAAVRVADPASTTPLSLLRMPTGKRPADGV